MFQERVCRVSPPPGRALLLKHTHRQTRESKGLLTAWPADTQCCTQPNDGAINKPSLDPTFTILVKEMEKKRVAPSSKIVI